MGISEKLKSHFWLEFNPSPLFLPTPKLLAQKGLIHEAEWAHKCTHLPVATRLTRWKACLVSCLMCSRYVLSPGKCVIISLQTKYAGVTMVWGWELKLMPKREKESSHFTVEVMHVSFCHFSPTLDRHSAYPVLNRQPCLQHVRNERKTLVDLHLSPLSHLQHNLCLDSPPSLQQLQLWQLH